MAKQRTGLLSSADCGKVLIREYSLKDDSIVIEYKKVKEDEVQLKIRKETFTGSNAFSAVKHLVYEVFLPRGYPESVSEDYTWYQIWDTLQACCSTFSGMLAVQSVLEGVGVGRENATPLAAALAWFTKDGVGMIASIFFAWYKGCFLDSDCKKWRLFADALNDLAFCIELSISAIVDRTVLLLCVSSAMKAVVGVAGGATRAALTHHQATRGNTADVAAKDGSQETVVNLAAMSLGVWLLNTTIIQSNLWIVMSLLVTLHLFCNFKAVKSLRLRKFNVERYLLVIDTYLRSGKVPSLAEVNLKESVILGRGASISDLSGFSIFLGVTLKNHQFPSPTEMEAIISSSEDANYLIVPNIEMKRINIPLKRCASDIDVLKAYFHGFLLANLLSKEKSEPSPNTPLHRLNEARRKNSCELTASWTVVGEEFSALAEACAKEGWILQEHVLHVEQWRAEWMSSKKHD